MSNSFKLCPTYFSREGETFSKGGFSPVHGYGPGDIFGSKCNGQVLPFETATVSDDAKTEHLSCGINGGFGG